MRDVDIIILGDGIVARTVALSAQHLGLEAVRVARPEPSYENDPRSYAIAPSSLHFLNTLGLGFSTSECTNVDRIEIGFGDVFSDKRYVLEKPNDPMMHMIDHSVLAQMLTSHITSEIIDTSPTDVQMQDGYATLSAQKLRAPLVIIAEGKNSKSSLALGISYDVQPYAQTAITAKFRSEIPHNNTARQLFTPHGPLGILPHGINEFSIVWSQDDAFAHYLISLSDDEFTEALETIVGGIYGKLSLLNVRSSFPLSHSKPSRLHGDRFALVGDCAHAIHPLAGQGLNLGLRDVASLMELVIVQKRLGLDIGDNTVLNAYANWRKGDVAKLSLVTKSLQKFSRGNTPIASALQLISKFNNGDQFKKIAEFSDAPISPSPKYLEGVKP